MINPSNPRSCTYCKTSIPDGKGGCTQDYNKEEYLFCNIACEEDYEEALLNNREIPACPPTGRSVFNINDIKPTDKVWQITKQYVVDNYALVFLVALILGTEVKFSLEF